MFTVSVEPWTRAQVHQLSYISVLNQHSLTILVASSPIGTQTLKQLMLSLYLSFATSISSFHTV